MSASPTRGALMRIVVALANIGVNPLERVRGRSIMASNRFFILGTLVCTPWVVVIGFADPPATVPPALTHLAMICAWILCLEFNRRRFHTAAATLGLAAPIVQFAYLATVFSDNASFQLPLITAGAIALVVFPPQHWFVGVSVTAIATVLLIWIEVGAPFSTPTVEVSHAWIEWVSVGNIVIAVLIVTVLAVFNNYYFVRERRRNDRLLAEAEVAARTDALTEVYNRRGVAPILSEVSRSGQYAVALADLDRFKRINDRLGHGAGDVVLASVARTLVEAVGERGTVARWGGEEFLIVLPRTTLAHAMEIMEGARKHMEEEYGADGVLEHVTVSVGVAHAPRFTAKDEVLRVADAKLYEAKASGRNVVVGATLVETDPL